MQAYTRNIASLLINIYNKEEKPKDKSGSKSGIETSQQSGDQSKSSLVETEEELLAIKVSKVVVFNLKENDEW